MNRQINTVSRRRFKVGKSKYPLLDASVLQMMRERRAAKKAVTTKRIQRHARSVFHNLYPENQGPVFKASDGWVKRFMKRNNVVNKAATSVGQKVPEDAPERCDMFLDEMKNLRRYDQYYNIDEIPCYFDIPRSKTFDFRGVSTVKLKTTGHEKLRFTVALMAGVQRTSDGYKAVRLPPLLIFKNLKKSPSGKYPPGMTVLGSIGGSMRTEFMLESYPKDFQAPSRWVLQHF